LHLCQEWSFNKTDEYEYNEFDVFWINAYTVNCFFILADKKGQEERLHWAFGTDSYGDFSDSNHREIRFQIYGIQKWVNG
jgi:hypothetical protein